MITFLLHPLQKFRGGLLALLALYFCASPLYAAITPAVPEIAARSYILMDFDSGRIIAADKETTKLDPASLTKMMTAYIVLDELKQGKIGLTDEVLISEKAWRMEGSRTFVEVDTKVPVETLLKGMIVQSGNDASVALAEHIAGSEEVFAAMMNQTATELGMNDSHFMNSTGLPDPEHYSNALDMIILARALIRNFPDHYAWYSLKEFEYNGISQFNRNKLLWRDDSVDGLKTGHTKSAGYCLVASAKRDNMRLISVVLGAKSENGRARETQKLLNYGFRFFETHRLYGANEALTRIRVWKGETEEVALGLATEMYVTLPRGEYEKLQANMEVLPQVIAPVNKGGIYGKVVIKIDEDIIAQAPLKALNDVPEGSLFQRLKDEALLLLE